MTLPPYSKSREGEGQELGFGVRNGSHTARSRPLEASRESSERPCPATSAEEAARCAFRGIDSAYRVVARERGNATRPGMVLLRPVCPEEAGAVGSLLRFLTDHPQAKLANAWREALIAWATRHCRRLSKNQARRVIERQRLGMIHAHSYLSELSLGDLRALVVAIEQIFVALGRRGNAVEEATRKS
jgi:hypothetical protein